MATELSDTKLEHIKELFKNWLSEENAQVLNLLITGKAGVGKTRLVNALIGTTAAKEGGNLNPCTSQLEPYNLSINNVEVTVWDSPGLQDGTTNEDLYIQDMKAKIKDVALMIYCVKMDDTRFRMEDKKAIQILTEEFGKEVWNHAVVVLTFANKVEDPDEGDKLQYFKNTFREWKMQFKDYFAAIGINPEVRIPVIPAGNWREMCLPDRENWLSDLWMECYHVMKSSARLGMYRINENRLMVEIPLNDQQQESLLWSTWEAFLPVLRDTATMIPQILISHVVRSVLRL